PGHKLVPMLAVNRHALALHVRPIGPAHAGTLVPVNFQPLQGFNDRASRLLGRTLQVRVLDAQHKRAAVVAGEQPVEQGRPGPAHVQVARGTRGVPGPYFLHALVAPLSSGCTSRANPSANGGRTTPYSVMIAVT